MTYISPAICSGRCWILCERRYGDRRGERKRKVGKGEIEKQEVMKKERRTGYGKHRDLREGDETETFTPLFERL